MSESSEDLLKLELCHIPPLFTSVSYKKKRRRKDIYLNISFYNEKLLQQAVLLIQRCRRNLLLRRTKRDICSPGDIT